MAISGLGIYLYLKKKKHKQVASIEDKTIEKNSVRVNDTN